jgi:hypothetical protein
VKRFPPPFRLVPSLSLCLVFLLAPLPPGLPTAGAQEIPTPEAFFGFPMGADGELAHWDRIVEYFQLLDQRSPRVKLEVLGESTLGKPFLLAIFSSPENLANLDRYREISRKLANPGGLGEAEIQGLIREGKYVSAQSYSLHATEVGGTQAVPELAYDLVTGEDPVTRMILDNTIFLMFPSFNPDGQVMVTEWFYRYKGTEYNHTSLPYLYHVYAGHNNNRDSYQLNLAESQHLAKVVYRDWAPQSYVDHHHFGGGGARFYIPPYLDPIHPNVDPLIWREHQLYGSHMAVALEQAGKSGIETGAPFYGWWQASFHMSTNYRNIAGMLTESASANWADPVYVLPDQLGPTRGRPAYKPQMSMPRLWPGGWWRLRDIVEQKIVASKAVLELGARYRETLLENMVLKAQGNIRMGETEPPYAYVIPVDQHDFPTAVKLVRTFQLNGVEVHRLEEPHQVGSRLFGAGSFVLSTAQPLRAFVKSFLEQVNYPDNPWTRAHGDQSPLRPYDLAGYSVSEHMGVEAIPLMEPLRGMRLGTLPDLAMVPAGTVHGTGPAYLLAHDSNESLRALNRLLQGGYQVRWLQNEAELDGRYFAPGAMVISGGEGLADAVLGLSRELGLDFFALPSPETGVAAGPAYRIRAPRVGVYTRYAGGNMDAGWTDLLLQDFEFNHSKVMNTDVRAGGLDRSYDIIILPTDRANTIIQGSPAETTPPQYRGGIGDEGVANLRSFVERGGTVIALNAAWEFVAQAFDLPLRDEVEGVAPMDFYCPGSTLHIHVDTSHPLSYGMPARALALHIESSPSLRVSAGAFQDGVSVAARYAEVNLLQSGWLLGEEYLSERPVALEFKVGEGKVVVLAFPAQHRAQTHGTYKFLFNGIFYGAAEEVGS